MRRLFWIGVGAAAGIYVMRRLQQAAESLSPESLAASLSGVAAELGEALREFAVDVRAGMTERETELRLALGLSEDGLPETVSDAR